jgi:hypothetical protein
MHSHATMSWMLGAMTLGTTIAAAAAQAAAVTTVPSPKSRPLSLKELLLSGFVEILLYAWDARSLQIMWKELSILAAWEIKLGESRYSTR